MWSIILLPLIAFFVGIIAAMIGIGGGVFMVPALVLLPWYALNPAIASGTSLATIVFTSTSSTLRYMKQKRIDYSLGLALASTTIPGAFLGSYLKSLIETRLLGIIFALFLLLVAIRMAFEKRSRKRNLGKPVMKKGTRRLVDSYGKVFIYPWNLKLAPMIGFASGFFSGLLGIGGGAVLVPAMNLGIGVPIHVSVATTMYVMIFTSIAGTLTNIWLRHVRFDYAILMASGIIFGAQLGAHYAAKVPAEKLRRIFGIVLLVTGVRMILKFTYAVP